jgi:purine-binding chemotaxis protein CheW
MTNIESKAAINNHLDTDGADNDIQQLVVFRLDDGNYGLDIQLVREINRLVEITPIPNAPEFVEGIINLRGSIVPVINLRQRFGLGVQERSQTTRIVVIENEGNSLGLEVDEVSEVLRISKNDIDPTANMTSSGIAANFIEGIGKVGDRLLLIMSPDKLFSTDEQAQIEMLATSQAA